MTSSQVPDCPALASSYVSSKADALSIAVESEEQIRWWPQGRVCLMEIGSYSGTGPTKFRTGLYPFGCLTQRIGTFVRVKHWVDSRFASPIGNPNGPKQQAWPCHMRLGIQLVTGKQSSNFASLDIEEHEAVYFHMPARFSNGSDGIETTISDLKALDPIVEDGDVKDDTLRTHLKFSSAMEIAYIRRMIAEKSLYEIEITTSPRNLAPSNVFIKRSEHETFQKLVDAVRDLHQHPDITSLSFRLIFCAPDVGKSRDDWIASVQRSIHNFRTAQKKENKNRNWLGEMYVKRKGQGLKSHANLYKDINEMPNFIPPHFDVAPSIPDMILMHGLDLHHVHEQEMAKLKKLEDAVFEARFIRLSSGMDQIFGCFVRVSDEQAGAEALVKGLRGHLTFPEHKDAGDPGFVLSRLPLVAAIKDTFLVVYFVDDTNTKLPCKVIDLKSGNAEQDLTKLILANEFTTIKLHAKYTNATESQHWRGLQAINPNMNETGKEAETAQYVCRILAGHGLEKVGRKPMWTVDILGHIESSLKLLNDKYAEAIGKPGAKFSDDQLRVIAYFNDAPDDLLLIIDGFAGTRKSSTMALLVCLLQMFQQTARVLVLAKMHKTINATAETMIPIVEKFLGKRVVRDWGDKADLYLLVWLVKGRPRDFDATWGTRGSIEEQGDLQDLMDCVEEAIKITPRASSKAPKHAICHTACWQILQELKNLNLIDLLSEGPQQGSKRPRTEDDNEETEPAKSRKLSTECIEESKKALASKEPELSPSDWKFKTYDLLKRIVDKLEKPWKKAEEKEFLQLLREIKSQWTEEFCGVWCTTVSRLDSREVKEYAATHVFMEEAHYVDDHDMKLMFAEFAKAWKILMGDSKRPAPYVKDRKFNKFSVVRRESTLRREIRRGRHHVRLEEREEEEDFRSIY